MSGLLDNPIALITVLLCIVIIFYSLKYTNKDSESFYSLTDLSKSIHPGIHIDDTPHENKLLRYFLDKNTGTPLITERNKRDGYGGVSHQTPGDENVKRKDIYNPKAKCVIDSYDTRKHYGILNDYHDACTVPSTINKGFHSGSLNIESPTSYHNLQQFCKRCSNKKEFSMYGMKKLSDNTKDNTCCTDKKHLYRFPNPSCLKLPKSNEHHKNCILDEDDDNQTVQKVQNYTSALSETSECIPITGVRVKKRTSNCRLLNNNIKIDVYNEDIPPPKLITELRGGRWSTALTKTKSDDESISKFYKVRKIPKLELKNDMKLINYRREYLKKVKETPNAVGVIIKLQFNNNSTRSNKTDPWLPNTAGGKLKASQDNGVNSYGTSCKFNENKVDNFSSNIDNINDWEIDDMEAWLVLHKVNREGNPNHDAYHFKALSNIMEIDDLNSLDSNCSVIKDNFNEKIFTLENICEERIYRARYTATDEWMGNLKKPFHEDKDKIQSNTRGLIGWDDCKQECIDSNISSDNKHVTECGTRRLINSSTCTSIKWTLNAKYEVGRHIHSFNLSNKTEITRIINEVLNHNDLSYKTNINLTKLVPMVGQEMDTAYTYIYKIKGSNIAQHNLAVQFQNETTKLKDVLIENIISNNTGSDNNVNSLLYVSCTLDGENPIKTVPSYGTGNYKLTNTFQIDNITNQSGSYLTITTVTTITKWSPTDSGADNKSSTDSGPDNKIELGISNNITEIKLTINRLENKMNTLSREYRKIYNEWRNLTNNDYCNNNNINLPRSNGKLNINNLGSIDEISSKLATHIDCECEDYPSGIRTCNANSEIDECCDQDTINTLNENLRNTIQEECLMEEECKQLESFQSSVENDIPSCNSNLSNATSCTVSAENCSINKASCMSDESNKRSRYIYSDSNFNTTPLGMVANNLTKLKGEITNRLQNILSQLNLRVTIQDGDNNMVIHDPDNDPSLDLKGQCELYNIPYEVENNISFAPFNSSNSKMPNIYYGNRKMELESMAEADTPLEKKYLVKQLYIFDGFNFKDGRIDLTNSDVNKYTDDYNKIFQVQPKLETHTKIIGDTNKSELLHNVEVANPKNLGDVIENSSLQHCEQECNNMNQGGQIRCHGYQVDQHPIGYTISHNIGYIDNTVPESKHLKALDRGKYYAWCDKAEDKNRIDLVCSDKYGNRGYHWANKPKRGIRRCNPDDQKNNCGNQDGLICPTEQPANIIPSALSTDGPESGINARKYTL